MPNSPTIYSSTDASAPILDETIGIAMGSLNYLLKKILVDGYGSKLAAGWTLTNTQANTRAFLTNGGSQSYFIVEDLENYAQVSSAKSVVSLEPTIGTQITSTLTVRKTNSYSNADIGPGLINGGPKPWWAMASSRYIYLFIDTGNLGAYALSLFAGDLNSIKPGDTDQFMIAANENDNGNSRCPFFINTYGINDGVNNGFSTIVKTSSALANGSCGLMRPFSSNGIFPIGGGGLVVSSPNPANLGFLFSVVAIMDGSSQIRGFLPNAYYPWHSEPLLDNEIRDLGQINIVAKTFDKDENGTEQESRYNSVGQIWLDYESPF
jgi:hypothetical protein